MRPNLHVVGCLGKGICFYVFWSVIHMKTLLNITKTNYTKLRPRRRFEKTKIFVFVCLLGGGKTDVGSSLRHTMRQYNHNSQ